MVCKAKKVVIVAGRRWKERERDQDTARASPYYLK
jgi:hypothetical protein